jgi:hypothetical protein
MTICITLKILQFKIFKKYMYKFIFLFILSSSLVSAEGLSISLSPETTTVEAGKTARVKVNFSQAPKKFSPTDISIESGTVDSVRKLSTRVYLAVVRASEDAKEVELQIQADAIRDNEGDLNENASNSVRIKVTANTQKLEAEAKAKTEQSKLENEKTLNSLLNIVTQNAKNNAPAITPAPAVQYYNCNGQAIPTTQQCVQNANVNTNSVLYIPSNNYGSGYNPYGNYGNNYSTGYVVYPTGLYSSYEMSYYDRYYNNYGYYPKAYYTTYYNTYGYYPESYYSSPYYEIGYGFGSGLRGLFDW